jgi:hypothetical protein
MLLPLVFVALLDRIPDDPGVLKQRQFERGERVVTPPGSIIRADALIPWISRTCGRVDRRFQFDVERNAVSAGVSDLRFAADSSPPMYAS